ncbi:hypothetical protein GCM10022243_61370 [Saccharothrix violaceirubra]|uniref:DUF2231 domain-containing protein n=1 Tax=Saccharothrix violaceirubra TaxID=413306 RepID=A0A7W7T7P6_9PSEU|nr:DUF2231 domain-containing protein [Saccharothrix violaceirubra]MBB4968113.1 hypothetical protein [Saccharothrix violaceirubra]
MALADDLVKISGIPAHPLLVHAVVVLLPLACLAAAAIAVRPVWRRRYAWPVLGLTLVGVAAVPVAQETGEQLYEGRFDRLGNPLIDHHASLGNDLLPFALGFGVAVVALLIAGRLADREHAAAEDGGGKDDGGTTTVTRTWRRIAVVIAVVVVASGAAAVVQTVRIGDSGSRAVWEGVGG